jgi:hypothetical protein
VIDSYPFPKLCETLCIFLMLLSLLV